MRSSSSSIAVKVSHLQGHAWPGVDEAGRGPLCVAAVRWPGDAMAGLLRDSKKLTEAKRAQLFPQIQATALDFHIVTVTAPEVDAVGVFKATMRAMVQAWVCLLRRLPFWPK